MLKSVAAVVVALVLLALAVPLTAAPVMVNAEEASQNSTASQEIAGDISAPVDVSGSAEKQEVVYASLNNAGGMNSVYVVNVLKAAAGQAVQDFGTYDQVVNLTDTSTINQLSDSVILTMPESETASDTEFSYQGSVPNAQIPWNISITYLMDGQEISAEDLAGKTGSLKLRIETAQNQSVDPRYYENYLMQITCTLPMENATNVKTDQGSIALSGSDVTVSFMVMPDADGNVSLSADVTNFEMSGISFAAIPFSMALDFPDTDSLVSQFDALIDGTEQLHSGAQDLAAGVSSVDAATKQAATGAANLATGATRMTQGLQQYQQGLRDSAAAAQDSVSEEDIADARQNYEAALGEYAAAFTVAYEQVMAKNPEMTQQEALQAAAQQLAGSFQEQAMNAALQSLLTVVSTQIASQGAVEALTGAADGLGSVDDVSSLLGGSASLGTGAQELASGLDQLAGGTGELASGVGSLTEGTQALAQETQEIPDKVQAEIDALMATYDKSDFEPASFTSSKNTNVTLVQFVMTTDSIKVVEPEQPEEPEAEETLLDKFFALF
ncbi:MAG TPA: hypothetical protein OIM20_01770 [Eggerthellaceae bacterium]|nr:hypothetical protein [Eggerthellaceae bacterium]